MVGDEDDVADDGEGGGRHHEGGALLETLRYKGDDDGEDCGEDVGGDGEELGLGGGEAEVADNGGLVKNISLIREPVRSLLGVLTKNSDRVYNGRLIVWKAPQ